MQGQALLPGSRERRRGNGLRLGQEKLRVDFGKIPSPKGLSSPGTAIQGRTGLPFLKELKNCVAVWS